MLRQTLKGTGVALVTPFKKDKSIDFDVLEKLIDIQIAGGVDYVVSLGTTGESVVLSFEEKLAVLECTYNKENALKAIPTIKVAIALLVPFVSPIENPRKGSSPPCPRQPDAHWNCIKSKP